MKSFCSVSNIHIDMKHNTLNPLKTYTKELIKPIRKALKDLCIDISPTKFFYDFMEKRLQI